MTAYKLVHSKRKTIGIHITDSATVEVRAPMNIPKSEIDSIVSSKHDWIQKHLIAMEQRMGVKLVFALNYGDSVILRGVQYPIAAGDSTRAGYDGERFIVPSGMSSEIIKSAVIKVYKLIAKQMLSDRVAQYSRQMGLSVSNVKVNSAKARWGSCSGKNSLNFPWRLIMADDGVIDYVVVHELAHIRERNHSDRFWKTVASVLPDYRERQERLKELQKKLATENWD